MPDTPKSRIDVTSRNPHCKSITVALARQLGKTERARLEAIMAAYAKAYDSVHSPAPIMLEELRRLGWELVRRG